MEQIIFAEDAAYAAASRTFADMLRKPCGSTRLYTIHFPGNRAKTHVLPQERWPSFLYGLRL